MMDASYTAVTKASNGPDICLREYWQDKVITVERKPDRIIYMKLVIPGRSNNILYSYAPQLKRRKTCSGTNLKAS